MSKVIRGNFFWFDFPFFCLFKISDAFENEMAKKVKLQNILSQLRKCVDHPYLFDGETVLFFSTLFVTNIPVAKIIAKFFKRLI